MDAGSRDRAPGEPEPRERESGRRLEVRTLGVLSYASGLELQAELVRKRRLGEIPDQLLLLEHPHVITLGSTASEGHVLAGPERRAELGIELAKTGRGGDVTYHGPGQLVGYPILDLNPDRRDIHRYLRDLEEVLIQLIGSYGIPGWRVPGRTGVWTEGGKVAAIGVRVSSGWITSHGFALNVSTDLTYFGTIVPCGIAEEAVTSLDRILDRPTSIAEVGERVAETFGRHFGRIVERVE